MAGVWVPLLWVFYPKTKTLHVYKQGRRGSVILGVEDTLDGDEVLPGFHLPISAIFSK
jgi:Uma2 family endonuclease